MREVAVIIIDVIIDDGDGLRPSALRSFLIKIIVTKSYISAIVIGNSRRRIGLVYGR